MVNEEVRPKRRRTWGCLGLCGLVLLGLVLLPWGLGVALKRGLVEELENQLDARVQLDELGVSWSGKLELKGLRVTGRDGFEHLAAKRLFLDVEVGELFAGRVAGTLDLSGLALHLRQDEGGAWSYEDLIPASKSAAETESEERREGNEPAAPGSSSGQTPVRFTVRLSGIELLLETPQGQWTQGLSGNLKADTALDELELRGFQLDGDLAKGDLSGMLRGIWSGKPVADPLLARLTYIPDKVAPLLQAQLPAGMGIELRGADQQPLELELNGPLDLDSIERQLRESKASGHFGLGQLSMFGLDVDGDLDITSEEDGASFGAQLGLDGGAVAINGTARLYGEDQGAQLAMELSAIPVDGQIARLLASVHPIFATAARTSGVDLAGFLDGSIDLAWSGVLPTDAPEQGWGVRDLAPLSLAGKLEFADLELGGFPFADSLLSLLGGSQGSTWSPSPLEFHLDGDRLAYDKPWTWTIGETETRFEGAVGLDGQLHLVWRIPIDERLAARRSELQAFKGETLSVPINGSLDSPKIEWEPAVAVLFQALVTEQLAEQGIDLGSIGDLLQQQTGTAAGSDDPGALLKQADRLWEAGDRTAAGKLYTRLRRDFPLSPAYFLNRKRVKRRKDG